MDLNWLLPLAGFALITCGTPGPNNMLLTSAGAAQGFRRTLPLLVGVVGGINLMILATALGLGVVFEKVPLLHDGLKLVGSAYLLWLCGRHLLAARLRRSDIDASAGSVEEMERIIGRIRARWPRTRVLLRADSQGGPTVVGFNRGDASFVVIERGGIELSVNGAVKQKSDVDKLIWNIREIIADLSLFYHLQPGDLIYTGTPEGVGAVLPGDRITGHVEGVGPVELTVGPAA